MLILKNFVNIFFIIFIYRLQYSSYISLIYRGFFLIVILEDLLDHLLILIFLIIFSGDEIYFAQNYLR